MNRIVRLVFLSVGCGNVLATGCGSGSPSVPAEPGLYDYTPVIYGTPSHPPSFYYGEGYVPTPPGGCRWSTDWYAAPRNGLLAFNISVWNICEDTPIRFRVSMSLYEDHYPGQARSGQARYLGSTRIERVITGWKWMCGEGTVATACLLPGVRDDRFERPEYGNLDHYMRLRIRACFPEDPCPWPDFPEPCVGSVC